VRTTIEASRYDMYQSFVHMGHLEDP
jgi:hypothetical protein